MQNYDVFLVGRYFCDLVFTGLPEFPRLGHEVYSREFHLVPGGVYTPAVALKRLGIKTVWPCKFGSDPFSQLVNRQALDEGVSDTFFEDTSDPSIHITASISSGTERSFLSYVDPLPKYEYASLIEETHPKWIYITHLLLGEELDDLVSAARLVGAKIFMDCQAHDHTLEEPQLRDALRQIDVFAPNLTEARQLTQKTDLVDILGDLIAYVPAGIIKDGKNGCDYQDEAQIIHEPGIDVQVVDTTGAGDNFNCGFLYGQVKGHSIRQSLRIANICGGLSAQGFGGTAASPDEEEILTLLKNNFNVDT